MSLNPNYSLRARFLLLAFIMCSLVASVVYFAYQNITTTNQIIIENLNLRNGLEGKIESIQTNIFTAYQNLNAFLVDPSRENLQTDTIRKIHQSISLNQQLFSENTVINQELEKQLYQLVKLLEMFETNAIHLMEIRHDNEKLFPAISISNAILTPSQLAFENALGTAISKVEAITEQSSLDQKIYQSLIQIRYDWGQMVSEFRSYLTNLFGSLMNNSISVQEALILNWYTDLVIQFDELSQITNNNPLTPQVNNSLKSMRHSVDNFHNGYLQVKKIHRLGEWRADTIFIRQNLEPLVEEITRKLSAINDGLHYSDEQETLNITKVAETQILVMWSLAIFCLIFLALVLFFVEKLVFTPIQYISKKIKADSLGIAQISLPKVFTKETKELVDAFRDMRDQVHHRQMELEYQALHDALTGLPNRIFLHDRLDMAIRNAHREKQSFSLLLIDLDRFKDINDTLGHHIGDQLLIQVGYLLVGILREVDTVARLGGDEFAIILPNTDVNIAQHIAKLISQKLEIPIVIENMNLQARASIGIAVFPLHGEKDTVLMQKADVAMYSAKKQKSAYVTYNPKRDKHSVSRLSLMNDLNSAIDQHRLTMVYQPAFDMGGVNIRGVECLVRWSHPEFGEIPATDLIAIAEQTTMINSITYWVFDTAFKQYAEWQKNDVEIKIAINLSVTNLQQQNFLQQLEFYISRYKVNPNNIVLEITEHAMMANPGRVLKTLSLISELGVNLSIDDYGTGFSSLTYLKQLPVSELKIDKSFVVNLPEDKNDLFIVKSTIEMAHNLGLCVVAEGVESEAALICLRELDCDTVQGYFLSQPINNNKMSDLLYQRTTQKLVS